VNLEAIKAASSANAKKTIEDMQKNDAFTKLNCLEQAMFTMMIGVIDPCLRDAFEEGVLWALQNGAKCGS